MERVLEGDELRPLRCALGEMVTTRGLDRALHRFGSRIGEEHGVGEGVVHQPLRQMLPLRATVQVGDVDQRRRLILDRLGQLRMAVAQQINRDAGGEIQIALAILADQVAPLASHRTHATPWVDGHERRDGHDGHS